MTADHLEHSRTLAAAFFDPVTLAEGAAATTVPAPDPSSSTSFTYFAKDARPVLNRAFHAWRRQATQSGRPINEARQAAAFVLHDAFERRRKNREETLEAMDDLSAGWAAQARALAAERAGDHPRRLIAVQIPQLEKHPHADDEYDPLTVWEAGVVAVYQIAVD